MEGADSCIIFRQTSTHAALSNVKAFMNSQPNQHFVASGVQTKIRASDILFPWRSLLRFAHPLTLRWNACGGGWLQLSLDKLVRQSILNQVQVAMLFLLGISLKTPYLTVMTGHISQNDFSYSHNSRLSHSLLLLHLNPFLFHLYGKGCRNYRLEGVFSGEISLVLSSC